MWHRLEFSSETIDNLKNEIQRLRIEAERLIIAGKKLEEEKIKRDDDYSYALVPPLKTSFATILEVPRDCYKKPAAEREGIPYCRTRKQLFAVASDI